MFNKYLFDDPYHFIVYTKQCVMSHIKLPSFHWIGYLPTLFPTRVLYDFLFYQSELHVQIIITSVS